MNSCACANVAGAEFSAKTTALKSTMERVNDRSHPDLRSTIIHQRRLSRLAGRDASTPQLPSSWGRRTPAIVFQ